MSFLPSSLELSAVLFDTLLWTAALIALVLVLRRPVTRWFGAPAAYALWVLPMLRLFLPPIELPAWLAPAKDAAPQAAEPTGAPILVEFTPQAARYAPADPAPAPVEAAPSFLDTAVSTLAGLPLTEIALAAWLGGAAVFLFLRFNAYFRLRDELVEGAVEVGTTKGPLRTIRLIETPNTTGPLAFGVLDPVIALPPGFMASVDRDARDLALAHELEHHRGHDLLINIVTQPLFALHWFNPLGRFGWLALRRDQEAACDARVMAAAPKEARALYANVIASFAAGPNVALAAPMACPVLGDKSIIQRLRNLKMNDDASNTKSRKMASRLMLGAAVLALPLTASVTYAEGLAPAADAVAPVAPFAPQAPTPPAAPAVGAMALAAPQAPEAPETGSAKEKTVMAIVTVDPDTGETETIDITSKDVKDKGFKYVSKNKEVVVLRKGEEFDSAELRRQLEDMDIDLDIDLDDLSDLEDLKDLKDLRKEMRKVMIVNRGGGLEDAEVEVIIKEMREGLDDAREAAREARIELKALQNSDEWKAMIKEGQSRTIVTMSCDNNSDEVATTLERKDGQTEVMICQSRVMAQALEGLEQARAAIAESREMTGKMRKEVLKELDTQIKNWRKEVK